MQPFHKAEYSGINYFALLVVIVIGVAAGNLLSNFITAKIVEIQVAQAAAEASRAMAAQAQQARRSAHAAAVLQAQHEARLREARRMDAIGNRLARACMDWRQADLELHSDTTRLETERHCSRYQRYLDTGQRPPGMH